MNNPLSRVGPTPRPEEAQTQGRGAGAPDNPAASERPATRLPQHPRQQQTDTQPSDQKPGERQQTATQAADTVIPASTDAD